MMNNKHDRHCEEIAKTLEKYASGDYFLFDAELYPIDPDDEFWNETEKYYFALGDDGFYYYHIDGDKIEESEVETATLYDYFEDGIYDINYVVNSYKELEAVRIMIACGGPNIYINTWDKQVELYWWSESGKYYLSRELCDQINDYFEELYNC